MKNRLAKILLSAAAVAAFAAPVAAQARQGADDPAGHVRHAAHTTTTATPTAARIHHRHHGRHHTRRADDSSVTKVEIPKISVQPSRTSVSPPPRTRRACAGHARPARG